MTRFMMTLEDAVDLVLHAFKNGKGGEIFVQKAPGATLTTLVSALKGIYNVASLPVSVIGTRHGEKLFEVLLSREEMAISRDIGEYFCIPPDLRDLNYGKFVEAGDPKISNAVEYNSHNTERLSVESMKHKLLQLKIISNGR